ncbi:hypothetical protein BASA81_000697 [Batrachochytrium salamandrivorans]|nr:hypothetical protein BASA81_000697 [Batrachochytrium salamandrivorans]
MIRKMRIFTHQVHMDSPADAFPDMEEEEEEPFPTVTIVIDASNVCWGAAFSTQSSSSINRARPPLLGLSLCVNFFERHRLESSLGDLEIIAVAPDWWQRETHMDTEDQESFNQLVHFGRLIFAPSGQHDDLIILQEAGYNPHYSLVVTNDQFRDHTEEFGLNQEWLSKHRVGFGFQFNRHGQLEFSPELDNLLTLGRNGERDKMEVDICKFFEPAMWELTNGGDLLPKPPQMFQHVEDLSYDESMNLGVFIGASGNRIKKIQQRFGCEIHVLNDTDQVLFRALSNDSLLSAKLAFFSPEEFKPDPPVKPFIAPLDSIKGGARLFPEVVAKPLSIKAKEFQPLVMSSSVTMVAPIDPIPYQHYNVPLRQPEVQYVPQSVVESPHPVPIPHKREDAVKAVATQTKKKSTIAPIDKLGKH